MPPPARLGAETSAADTRGDDHAELSHTAVLLNLAWGGGARKLDQASASLERLELGDLEPPARARIRSDLAAVYYSRAILNDDPSLFLDALEAASQALHWAPELEEALFNRALALTALSLRDQAGAAWQRYLEVDAASPWGLEAGERLANLPRTDTSDPAAEPAELLICDLGTWAEAIDAGDGTAARKIAEGITSVAGELFERTGDPLARDLAGELSRLDSSALSRAFSDYARGRRAFWQDCYQRTDEPDACADYADDAFQRAGGRLRDLGSALRHWTRAWQAGVYLVTGRHRQAMDELAALEAALPPGLYPALEGRLHWTRGLALLRRGRLASAAEEYTAAVAAFAAGNYHQDVAAMRALRAEAFSLMGLLRRSWRDRILALDRLGWLETWSWRRHNLLLSAADTAKELGLGLAFRAISDEAVGYAAVATSTRFVTCWPDEDLTFGRIEARLWRAEGLASFDDPAAWADVVEAASELGRMPEGDGRKKLAADVAVAAHRLDPRAELGPELSIENAIETRRGRGVARTRLIDALVVQARGLRLKREHRQAAASLDRAIDLLEEIQADLESSPPLDPAAKRRATLSHWETSQPVLDQQFELRLERGEAIEDLLEQAISALTLPGARPPIGEARPGLAGERRQVVVYYATPSIVAAWSLGAGGLEGRVLDVSPGELERRIESFVARLRRGILDRAEAGGLYRILLGWSELAAGAEDVVVVPDRFLHRLPFAALIDGSGRHLVEAASLRTVSSMSTMPEDRGGVDWAGPALMVGDPSFDARLFPWLQPLGGAAEETRRLATLLPDSRVLVGAEATRDAVLAALPGASILHLAAHTTPTWESDASGPLLVLASAGAGRHDSVLAPEDLDRLDLSVPELVFLAACRTAPGGRSRMQGLHGLAAPFLDRGARAVVATYWDIVDADSVALVEHFYRSLLSGREPAAALRAAQVAMIHSGDPALSSARTWAAFQLLTHQYS